MLQYVRFVELGDTSGVPTVPLPQRDDGISEEIIIDGGFPFGNSSQTSVWVCEDTTVLILFAILSIVTAQAANLAAMARLYILN